MATGMKRWIGATAGLMVLFAAWRLPPGEYGLGEVTETVGVEERFRELSSEARWTEAALVRVRWADSLSALALEIERGGVAFAVPADMEELITLNAALEPDGPMQIDRIERRVRREVAALPRRADDMVFGYFHQPFDHGEADGIRPENRNRGETYVGSRDGSDYCLHVRVSAFGVERGIQADIDGTYVSPPVSNSMGACRLYVQYGMPGPGIETWLENGAIGFAMEVGAKAEASDEAVRSMRLYRAFGLNTLTGFRRSPIEVDQCRAGIAHACGRLVVDPPLTTTTTFAETQLVVARTTPAIAIHGRPLSNRISQDEAYLLADLEADFGGDAFAEFWTSDQEMEQAFESAFGTTIDEWMVGWVEGMRGVMPSSPELTRAASSGTVLAVSVFLLLAFARNRKRSVA